MAKNVSGEVKCILEAVFEKSLVSEDSFSLKKDSEKIKYWQGDYNCLYNPDRYIIGNHGYKLDEMKQYISHIEKGNKGFLFYRFERCKEFLFSLEIINYKSLVYTQ